MAIHHEQIEKRAIDHLRIKCNGLWWGGDILVLGVWQFGSHADIIRQDLNRTNVKNFDLRLFL